MRVQRFMAGAGMRSMRADRLPACLLAVEQMAYGYEEGGLRPGAVTFFPDSAPYWVSTAGLEEEQRGGRSEGQLPLDHRFAFSPPTSPVNRRRPAIVLPSRATDVPPCCGVDDACRTP